MSAVLDGPEMSSMFVGMSAGQFPARMASSSEAKTVLGPQHGDVDRRHEGHQPGLFGRRPQDECTRVRDGPGGGGHGGVHGKDAVP